MFLQIAACFFLFMRMNKNSLDVVNLLFFFRGGEGKEFKQIETTQL